MIYEVTSKLLAKEASEKVAQLGIEEENIALQIMLEEWQYDGRLLLLEEIKDKITGVFYAVPNIYRGRSVLFIIYAGADKDRKNTIFEFLARAKKRAREIKVNKLIFLTRRNPKAFAKKYKFHPVETLLEYKLQEE